MNYPRDAELLVINKRDGWTVMQGFSRALQTLPSLCNKAGSSESILIQSITSLQKTTRKPVTSVRASCAGQSLHEGEIWIPLLCIHNKTVS